MTTQEEQWLGQMGREYTGRNTLTAEDLDQLYLNEFGLTRTYLNERFLRDVPSDTRILEVGCNIGMQLRHLQRAGFTDLQGIELQQIDCPCVENVSIRQGSATELPYEDGEFDLVFTSGLLIHISLYELRSAIREITRVSRCWIWGFEYYTADRQSTLEGRWEGMLWTDDYPYYFLYGEDMRMIRRWSEKYRSCDWVADMYLLRKE